MHFMGLLQSAVELAQQAPSIAPAGGFSFVPSEAPVRAVGIPKVLSVLQ